MDVRALVEDFEKSLCTLDETLMHRGKSFSLLVCHCTVSHNFIEHWLVIIHWICIRLDAKGLLGFKLKQILNALSLE
jgi:hypothetical protein